MLKGKLSWVRALPHRQDQLHVTRGHCYGSVVIQTPWRCPFRLKGGWGIAQLAGTCSQEVTLGPAVFPGGTSLSTFSLSSLSCGAVMSLSGERELANRGQSTSSESAKTLVTKSSTEEHQLLILFLHCLNDLIGYSQHITCCHCKKRLFLTDPVWSYFRRIFWF